MNSPLPYTENYIEELLYNAGSNYIDLDNTKAIGILREAVHMYIKVDPESRHINKIWDELSQKLNHHHRI